MSNEVASLESDLNEYRLQLETVQSGLQADPDNAELQNLKAELEEHKHRLKFRRRPQ